MRAVMLLVLAALPTCQNSQETPKVDCSDIPPYVAPELQEGQATLGQAPRFLHQFGELKTFEGELKIDDAQSAFSASGNTQSEAVWLEIDDVLKARDDIAKIISENAGTYKVSIEGRRVVQDKPFACWGYGAGKKFSDLILVERFNSVENPKASWTTDVLEE